ncbi:MAG: S-methyl-5'-thioadenosine phosphorylase [Nitrospirales bacterium]|nr:S-methyl-5'-thioadenosine phosphorylase [Nitrospira sp.]MDR4501187.1 S-methyl-5'-thioadenosine phosphorylase [Nitrospirales bacterium]
MPTKLQADIGIIGGSGLYQMEGLEQVQEVRPQTPFGRISDRIVLGNIAGKRLAFLARHGKGHTISPSQINYRANIYALKSLGVSQVFSVSAVGSMKETIKPGDFVLPDQFIDRTTQRSHTFFDQGLVAHVSLADPICSALSSTLQKASQEVGQIVHRGGTYLCIEGPQFSTKAESRLYRQWGVDIIGMTNIPEAKLAREAELCYATLALVTDFDCWHETEEAVSVGAILNIMKKNVKIAQAVLKASLRLAPENPQCSCQTALEHALVTPPEAITAAAKKRVHVFFSRQWGKPQTPKR